MKVIEFLRRLFPNIRSTGSLRMTNALANLEAIRIELAKAEEEIRQCAAAAFNKQNELQRRIQELGDEEIALVAERNKANRVSKKIAELIG